MKKTILFIAVLSLAFSPLIKSQELGVSGSALIFLPKFKDVEYSPYFYNPIRVLGHTGNVAKGIRVEANYILPGYSIPVSGFNGLGVSFFLPVIDSCVFNAKLKNGSSVDWIVGTGKTTITQINLRSGYEIPQSFNEFLLLHFGWGMGFMHTKTNYILPERSLQFPHDESDFDPNSFTVSKHGFAEVEVLVGAVYEFEFFSAMAQYSVIFGMTNYMERNLIYQHGLSIGIFYPLKKL